MSPAPMKFTSFGQATVLEGEDQEGAAEVTFKTFGSLLSTHAVARSSGR